jgi:hypothetical protein
VVVVRSEHVQRLAILAERDGTRADPWAQVASCSGEVRMRIEAQAPRVLNRAENDLTGQLYGRLDRIAAVSGKVPADETAQVAFVHWFRAEGVLHPEAVDVG